MPPKKKRKNDFDFEADWPPTSGDDNGGWLVCVLFGLLGALVLGVMAAGGFFLFLDNSNRATQRQATEMALAANLTNFARTLSAPTPTATFSPTPTQTLPPTATATSAFNLGPPTTTRTPTPFAATFLPQLTEVPLTNSVIEVVWAPDNQTVIAASPFGVWFFSAVAPAQEPSPLAVASEARRGLVVDIALSPDGQRLAVAYQTGEIDIWALDASPRQRRTSWNAQQALHQIAFSPDGAHLAAVGEEGAITVWRADDGGLVNSLAGELSIFSVAFSPDGTLVAAGRADGLVQLWDVASGEMVQAIDAEHFGFVQAVAFAPRQPYIATLGEGGPLYISNIATGERVSTLSRSANDVAFSPVNTDLIASADEDSVVRLWSIGAGREILHLPAESEMLAVAFRRDGGLIVGGGADGRLTVWQVGSGAVTIEWQLPSS